MNFGSSTNDPFNEYWANYINDSEGNEKRIAQLHHLIDKAPQGGIVFFGGAGVSTESGIPDFRSADGLYAQKFAYPPEVMLSRSFFDTHPKEFFDFYFAQMLPLDAQPNRAHSALAQLEAEGKLSAVITQNIDGLHQRAGSKNVFELHGSVLRNSCMACGHTATAEEMLKLRQESLDAGGDGVPRCPVCGDIMKPDVVLYEEPLNQEVMMGAMQAISQAKLMLVAGTSLVVNPAASMLQYFRGNDLVIVNKTPTPYDNAATLVIAGSIGDALSR